MLNVIQPLVSGNEEIILETTVTLALWKCHCLIDLHLPFL